MARILIVDDDVHVLEVIERVFRRQGHVVIIARNGREAIDLLESQTPDLAILDVVMPHVNGVQVCRHMRGDPKLNAIPILLLTVKERIEDKTVGFEAGADDYLTKPFDLSELELRAKALLRHPRRAAPATPMATRAVRLDADARQAQIGGEPVALTPVEFELFYHLVSHAGEVFSAERLLQEVWGYPAGTGNPSLVRMHVLNLRRKIEEDPKNPTYIRTVPRHGYTIPSNETR